MSGARSPSGAIVRPSRASDDDRALLAQALARVADGDRRALEIVYERTSAKLFGICLRILADGQHAEEALQDTFLSIWRRAARFDPARGTAMTWLMTLARNSAIDRHRQLLRGTGATVPLDAAMDPADPAPDPLAMASMRDEDRRLHVCLAQLERVDRQLITTAFLEGRSYPELATASGMPLPTLKSRVRRALLKLRGCMA